MDMLCIAAAHDPIGYVSVAGRPLGVTDIARMTGGSENEVGALLGELDLNGVFSRDRHGRIYSRRMVADAKKAAISRKNGKQGGNPSLSKDRGNHSWDNLPDKAPLKPQEPRASNQEPMKKATTAVAVVAREKETSFDTFWKAYPKKAGKIEARKQFVIALRRTDFETLMAGLDRAKASRKFLDGYAPDPERWLKKGCWEDEPDLYVEPRRDKNWRELESENNQNSYLGAQIAMDILAEKDRQNERRSQAGGPDGVGPALPEIVPDSAGTGALVIGLSRRLAGGLR